MTIGSGILVTRLLGSLSPGLNYTKATVTFIIMSSGMAVFSAFNMAYLSGENRWKTEKIQKVTREKPVGMGDAAHGSPAPFGCVGRESGTHVEILRHKPENRRSGGLRGV